MPHRVLVVDDEESIRSLIKDYLEGQGYRVLVAPDCDKALKMFENDRPHMAIVDFLLPPKNGFAVVESMRSAQKNARLPIIMMSGVFKNPKTAVEAREKYQVVEFLSKPLDLEQLSQIVSESLEGIEPDDYQPEAPAAIRPTSISPDKSASAPRRGRSGSKPPPRGLSYGGGGPAPKAEAGGAPQPRAPSVAELIQDGIYMGRPFPELDEEGEIETYPVALLLSTIRYDGSTGMLDMTDSGTHRRIYITEGNPTFMQSNAEGENVGALLLRRGRITEPDFDRCLRYMKDKRRTLQQSLLELKLVNEPDLATAYKLLAGQLLPLALGMSGGTFKWRVTDAFVGRVPEGRFDAMATLFDGIKRHVHPPQILKFFKGREDIPLVKTTEFEKLQPYFRRTFSATNIASQIDGGTTYRSITRSMSDDASTVIPQLFALATSGMCVLPELTESNAMEVAVNAAAADIQFGSELDGSGDIDLGLDDGGSDLSPEAKKAQARIERYYDDIMSQDFFRIFNAAPDTDEDTVKAAYFDLAKKWHTDSFANLGLSKSLLRKVDEIFQRITEAYDTITNPQRRGEYMVYLDRKQKGLPTDVNEILRGEQLYDQALAMIRRRDFSGAQSVLQEATRLNPDPLYYATLGWATFNVNQKSQVHVTEAVQQLKHAISEQENLPVAYQYLGQICFMRGQNSEAKKWWSRCLEWEPNNIDAARGIRMVNSRGESKGNKGLLSKFLKEK